MQLYVLQDDKSTGPFEEAEIISRWRKGILKGNDLVWTQGLDEWTPLARLLSVSNSTQILPKDEESHSEKKTEPNSVKWYERWQTWVVATATALVLWLLFAHITAHTAQQGSAKFRAGYRSSAPSLSPASAPPSHSPADDLVASFQRGVAKLDQRKALLFNCTSSENCEIRYDIRKTDSVVVPVVGIVTVKTSLGLTECQFSYSNARWKLQKYVYYVLYGNHYGEPQYSNVWDEPIQACFNTD